MLENENILSCGHEDYRKPLGWATWKESDITGLPVKALSLRHYCTDCLIKLLQEKPDKVWFNHEEAKEGIYGQTR